MATVYKITNKYTNQVYIGVTTVSLEERWRDHMHCMKRERTKYRPLYQAMLQYGTDAFEMEPVEVCSDDIRFEREKYWVNYYNSKESGYNMTYGGVGKPFADKDVIKDLFDKGYNCKQIAKKTGLIAETVSKHLKDMGYSEEEILSKGRAVVHKGVAKINMFTDEIVAVYDCIQDAYRDLGIKDTGTITRVCKGERPTFKGYKWRYLDDIKGTA